MLGYLSPCDGGPPIGLSKPKLSFRLRSQRTAESSGASLGGDGPVELSLKDGVWYVFSTTDGPRLQINNRICDAGKLLPGDVLTVGRHRFRINYSGPAPAGSTAPVAIPAAVPKPVAPPAPQTTLGILIPCGGGRSIPLCKPKILIGRAADCDVVLANRIVSSRHCELVLIDGYWQAVDLDSHNGTYVNGMRYRVKWVFPGNVLGVASHRFRMEYTAIGQRPSAQDDDVPILSSKSLMERAGLTEKTLDSLVQSKDQDEQARRRWTIDDV